MIAGGGGGEAIPLKKTTVKTTVPRHRSIKTLRLRWKIIHCFPYTYTHLTTTATASSIITINYSWRTCSTQTLSDEEHIKKSDIKRGGKQGHQRNWSLWNLQLPQTFITALPILTSILKGLLTSVLITQCNMSGFQQKMIKHVKSNGKNTLKRQSNQQNQT